MKGGQKPVLRQRWYPSDYHQDEHVRILYARRDWRTLTFYRTFLDASFMAGGDLPADPEALAAMVFMPLHEVKKALAFCLGRLIYQDGDRLYQNRARREIAEEMQFREGQEESGRRGGLTAGRGRPKGVDRASPTESIGQPLAVAVKPVPLPEPPPERTAPRVTLPPFEPHPLIPTREVRERIESEVAGMLREAPTVDMDPQELMAQSANYSGATRTKMDYRTMSHDRLLNTHRDMRKILAARRASKSAPSRNPLAPS